MYTRAFVGVTKVFYFVTMHGINNVKANTLPLGYKNQ
jgi:hypothetical protein